MTYRVEFDPRAARELAALPRAVQERIRTLIDGLPADPRPRGAVSLKGSAGLLRLRVGEYRVVYRVQDDALLVLVVKIGHRREVYRRR